MYWSKKEIPANDIRFIDTLPYHQPRRWYDTEGYAVEASSYALLTYLRSRNATEGQPIMKWLQEMRNTFAGQASTQVESSFYSTVCPRALTSKTWPNKFSANNCCKLNKYTLFISLGQYHSTESFSGVREDGYKPCPL